MKRETKSLSLSCSMGNTQFCKTTYEPHKRCNSTVFPTYRSSTVLFTRTMYRCNFKGIANNIINHI